MYRTSSVRSLGRVNNAFESIENNFDRTNYRFRLGSGEAWKMGGEVHHSPPAPSGPGTIFDAAEKNPKVYP